MQHIEQPQGAIEEFRRVFGERAIEWKKDKQGVFQSDIRAIKEDIISFPSSAYEHSELDLDSFWIYCRSRLILQTIQRNKISTIWEIGAGDGRVSIPLSVGGISVIASEPHYEGAQKLAQQGVFVCQASLKESALDSESIEALGMFDVLEHIEDTSTFLFEISRVMKPGALLFVTVPAHNWLFGDFDSSIGHFRRYSKKSLKHELNLAGFKPVEVRFFFASLIIPALLIRRIPYLLGRRKTFDGEDGMKAVTEDQIAPSPTINKILKCLLALDSKLKLPFGLSLLGVFQKV